MKEFKLPHLPSDPEKNDKDLISDLWYGVEEKKIEVWPRSHLHG